MLSATSATHELSERAIDPKTWQVVVDRTFIRVLSPDRRPPTCRGWESEPRPQRHVASPDMDLLDVPLLPVSSERSESEASVDIAPLPGSPYASKSRKELAWNTPCPEGKSMIFDETTPMNVRNAQTTVPNTPCLHSLPTPSPTPCRGSHLSAAPSFSTCSAFSQSRLYDATPFIPPPSVHAPIVLSLAEAVPVSQPVRVRISDFLSPLRDASTRPAPHEDFAVRAECAPRRRLNF